VTWKPGICFVNSFFLNYNNAFFEVSGGGFVQNIALPSLSRDRRIKMEQNKQTNFVNVYRRASDKTFF